MKRFVPPILFAVLATVLLLTYYGDMLHTAQWRTPFMPGEPFRDGLLAEPFGWLSYAGCWLTQSLYNPAVGVSVLLVIWLATWMVGVRALALDGGWRALMMLPMGCLVLSLTDVGYWIYCLRLPGYWFAQSLGYLCCLALAWLLGRLDGQGEGARLPRWMGWGIQTLACLAVYPVIGWYAYLLALCLALRCRNAWCLLTVFAPALWQQTLYPSVSMYTMWAAGFPLFAHNAILSLRPSVPFIALAALTMALAVAPTRRRLTMRQWAIGLAVVTLLTASGVWMGSFKDYNYQAEMRMTRLAMDDDWRGVIREAKATPYPSRTMVALKNLALLNTGQLGSSSYVLGNDGRDITNPDSINVNIMQIAAPLVYYNHGMINYASRWCTENAVAYGYSPYYLQMMARCAQATGEQAMCRRCLALLHAHAGYADWQPRPLTRMVSELRRAFANVIDADRNSCEHYVIDIFSKAVGSDCPAVRELNLFYAMLHGSPQRFWPAFLSYAAYHQDELLPQHYQEAYFYFMERYPVELPFKVQVTEQTLQAYKAFMLHLAKCQQVGADEATSAAATRQQWGKTFWWHVYFGQKRY